MYPREYFDDYWKGEIEDEVFVAMSFSDEFRNTWELAIRPAIEEDCKLIAHRVDNSIINDDVVVEILKGISHARVFFADISVCQQGAWAGQRNGNVMYEVGLAHAIRQPSEVVIVRSDDQQINFDVAGLRVHRYDRNDLLSARKRFAELIKGSVSQTDNRKALKVEQVVNRLDVGCLLLIREVGTQPVFYFILDNKEAMEELSRKGVIAATRFMLDQGIIKTLYDPKADKYSYIWTEFGKAVIDKVNSRG